MEKRRWQLCVGCRWRVFVRVEFRRWWLLKFDCGVGGLVAMEDLDGGDVGGYGLDERAVVVAVVFKWKWWHLARVWCVIALCYGPFLSHGVNCNFSDDIKEMGRGAC